MRWTSNSASNVFTLQVSHGINTMSNHDSVTTTRPVGLHDNYGLVFRDTTRIDRETVNGTIPNIVLSSAPRGFTSFEVVVMHEFNLQVRFLIEIRLCRRLKAMVVIRTAGKTT